MVRRSIRWRPPPPHVLSTPESVRIVECYGLQGKGAYHGPFGCTDFELVAINSARVVRIVPGYCPSNWIFDSAALAGEEGWLVLGWRMLDGSLPHGELDRVDPDLADLDALKAPNRPPYPDHG